MSTVNAKARSLLDAARADGPSAADRARIGAALAARLAPGSAPSKGSSTSVKAAASGSATPALVIAITAGLLSGAAPRWSAAPNPAASTTATIPAPAANVASDPGGTETSTAPPSPSGIAVESLEDAPAAPPAAPRRWAAPVASAAPDGDSLAAELRLLRAAQLARSGDPARSIALLDELGARYPRGVLAEERMAARVLALCAAGRVDEARAEGRAFLAKNSASVQSDRIRASCAFAKKTHGAATEPRGADH